VDIPAILGGMAGSPDPYLILGVAPTASDEELRAAYRRLAQRHHPDHNNGSRESALRFAEVQEAYAHVRLMRKQATAPGGVSGAPTAPAGGPAAPNPDPDLEARLAAMEQELRAARERREKAARAAAQEAARAAARAARAARAAGQTRGAGRARAGHGSDKQRPSDEELGYYTTDDSFTKILDDFADQVAARFTEAHPPPHPGSGPRKPRSVADWIDELGARLTGEHPGRPPDGDG
jgi:hypothetical protein